MARLADLEGVRAIVPGDLAQSEVGAAHFRRPIPTSIMPPPKSDKKLTPEEIATLEEVDRAGRKV